jgi:hypothetical protein
MSILRRAILAFALIAGLVPAFGQVPPVIPALPDADRRTTYTISGSTCACAVGFAIYGDSTDYGNWISVWINGVRIPSANWSVSSPTGSLGLIPRPITDAVLTFNVAQTGTVQIVGARRPRRVAQFAENRGVPARDLNLALTDVVAQNREVWDKINDLGSRVIMAPPGETLNILAAANLRANSTLGFDAVGQISLYVPSSAVTSAANVNFLQSGTGVISRTVQDDLRNTVRADQFGVKCDDIQDDAPFVRLAVAESDARGGVPVVMPKGICLFNSTVFLNKWTTPGNLTAGGLNIVGQGRFGTLIDSRVANGFAFAVNPDWKAAHQSLFGITPSSGGSGALATNTYYVWITVNAPNPVCCASTEVSVTFPKSIAVTGPGGRIAITLAPLNAGYSYNLYCSTAATPANYCIINGANASAIGGNQSLNLDAIGTAHVVPTSSPPVWQEAHISNLGITSLANSAGASAISYFKTGYADVTNVYVKNMLGNGFETTNYTGDVDGSFNTRIANSKFDNIAGWCIMAAGNVLELSNFTVDDRTIMNVCGTQPANYNTAFTISAITNASPGLLTTALPNTLATNDQVYIKNVAGMTLASGFYRVVRQSATTFNIRDLVTGVLIDTTALGAYTASSGTESLAWRPSSPGDTRGGCLSWLGLIGTFRNLDFTQCNNVAMYFSESGTSDNATIENVDFENTYGKPLYIAALVGGSLTNSEVLSTAAIGDSKSCAQLGTGFAAGGVQNFQIRNIKVRSDVIPANCWEQFYNTNIPGAFVNTVTVDNITYQAFDATSAAGTQTRTSGIVNRSIQGQAKFTVPSTNVFKLAPTGSGCTIPIHLTATGEWVPYCVPDAGITFSASTSAVNTTYNVYTFNTASSLAPISLSFTASTTGPATKDGYSTLPSDSTRTFVGTITTDGSGNFQPAGVQTSMYPMLTQAPISLVGGAVGCPTCVLISGTAKGDTNYSILSTDRYVYTTAAFTAPRTWTLPAANSLTAGTTIWIQDAASAVTSTNTLTIARAGADLIDGGGTTLVIANGGGGITFTTDGISNWGSPIQTASTGGTGRTNITNHAVMVGAGINSVSTPTVGTNGQLLLGATGADPAFATMSQDCTITAAGVTTCTKTNNVSFAAPATSAFAAKSDMQTPSSSVLVVNPRDVQDHPGVAKFWARLDGRTGSTCTIGASYNISGCVRNSAGNYTITFSTAFASTNYAAMLGGATNTGVNPAVLNVAASGYATGTLTFTCVISPGAGTVQDCDTMSISGYGSQ